MRRSRFLILVACLGALAAAPAFCFIRAKPLIDAKLLRVQGFPETPTNAWEPADPCIVLQITKSGAPEVEFAEDQAVQFRIAGKWLSPEKFDGLMLDWLEAAGCGRAGVIPNRRGAEAFRLHLTYRRQDPRNEAANWLAARGYWGKAPRFCRWLCMRLPGPRKWREVVIEVELPNQSCWSAPGFDTGHNQAGAVDAAIARLFAFERQWRLATDQRR